MQCPCGSTDIDTDSGRVDSVCRQCGSVLDDSGIVSEVQFAQDSHGASRAVGQLISFEGGSSYGFGHRTLEKESRQITINNARQNIQSLASRLQLKSHSVEAALNFYKMALTKQLTKGRKSTHVIAACVYMQCRNESTPHMLLDLSEILRINVYELGKTYLKLSSALCIKTPIIDPVLYITRFARQLEFGDKEGAVVYVATKLVSRMKFDWIHMGRRPSGLCGAALLVAARLHNFNRTIDDIIKVVKVCQATVRKRLNEFSDTPSGKLSIDDFMSVNLSEEQDPPCFKNARRKLRELEDENKVKDVEKQISEIRAQIEKVLENSKKKSPFENLIKGAEKATDDKTSPEASSNVDRIIAETTADTLKDIIIQDDSVESQVCDLTPILIQETESVSVLSSHSMEQTFESIGLSNSTKTSTAAPSNKDVDVSDDTLDLTGLDDKELDIYFMKPYEYERKDEVWHMYNADYLKELKEKEERRALEEEENAKKPNRKKKRKRNAIQGNTAGEVIEKIIQQKKISFKLDYDVLKSLNPENTSDVSPTKIDEENSSEITPVPRVIRPKIKRPPTLVPLNIKKAMSDIVGNNRRKALAAAAEEQNTSEDLLESETKKPRLEINEQLLEETEVITIDDSATNNQPQDIEEIEEEEEDEDSDIEMYSYKDEMPPDYYPYDEYVDDYEE